MNAFTKTFKKEDFAYKFSNIRPAYLMMGKEAFDALLSNEKTNAQFWYANECPPATKDYVGTFLGAKVYIMPPTFPSDKIIFGVE